LQKRLIITTAPLLVCLLLCAGFSSVHSSNKIPAYRPEGTTGTTGHTSVDSRIPQEGRGGSLNVYQKQRIDQYLSGFAVPLDTLRIVGLQTQFADSLMGGQPGSLRKTVRDSTWFAGELGHLADYVRGASRGKTELVWEMIGTLYNMPEGMKYYGNDREEEIRVVELAQTLIDSADSEVDFSRYDMVFIIHAGAGQETDIFNQSPEQIWSSFYDLGDIQTAADSAVAGLATGDSLNGEPFYVNNFSIVPENASQYGQTIGTLGIWAFEAGSRLGLLPMFDATPPGFIDSQGVGNFCVMSYGLFNADGFIPAFPCAFNRLIAGWIDPVTVDEDTQGLRLTDVNSDAAGDTVCVKIPITENEYYLVVNRVHDTNFDSLFTFDDADSNLIPGNEESLDGAEFDFFLTDLTNPSTVRFVPEYGFNVLFRHTGSGIYVWHVDENVVRSNTASGYLPNDFVDRKGVDLEEADGVQDLDAPGASGFAFGNHFDSFRTGDGNASSFGPDTKPDSRSNGGIVTGIRIDNTSGIGHTMTFDFSRSAQFEETRVRWNATGEAQPATAADIDGDGGMELVVLADTGLVYVFAADGSEYDDADGDPSTIAPYITAPGALWAGPPALGDMDGVAGDEIVAAAADGRLFAWRGDGTELTDGDNNNATDGVLYAGPAMAAPPLLLDFNGDTVHDVAIVESENDALYVAFIDPAGNRFLPSGDAFEPLWPVVVQGQIAAPPALVRSNIGQTDEFTGIALAWVDTVDGTANVQVTPAMWSGGVALVGEPVRQGWSYSWTPGGSDPAAGQVPSAPASGDVDGDGFDEVVITFGRTVMVFNNGTGTNAPFATDLRAGNASAPALGDTDLDGTLEIAVYDDRYMYVLKSSGSPATNWPVQILPEFAGEQPPVSIRRANESPVLGDFDGDGSIEVLFALQEGSIFGLNSDGSPMATFPRVGPAVVKATPTVAALGGGTGLGLVSTGFLEEIGFIDNVADTVYNVGAMTMAIQSLPGSAADARLFWPCFRQTALRQGFVTEGVPLAPPTAAVDGSSFYIYPNPVTGNTVHARVTLNAAAQVVVEVYNAEGERAFERQVDANPLGVTDTPLDEMIDVSRLKSGVYYMRLQITSDGGTEKLVKPFAIRR
jgi:M6 family metalloprotease-like protein